MKDGVIKNVSMVILLEKDLAGAVEFYKKLGLKLKFHLKGKWAEFELGNVKFGLCPTSQDLPDRRNGVVLEVEDMKKTFDQFKDSVDFLSEPYEAVHGIMVSFKDPGGNVLDLYQPTPEKVAELAKNIKKEGCCGGKGESCACG